MNDHPQLKLDLKVGAPVGAVPRRWYLAINNILKYLVVRNGRLIVSGDKWVIECGGGSFSGRAYTPGGILTEGLTTSTKPWVKYSLSTGIITEEVGPPAEPWGNDESWRKKSDLSGAAYF